jgi:Ca2+/H+ antiporter, TMEM165/GDT1 family
MSASALHSLGPMLAAFLASLVEFVEALTVVLAVGAVRGWRDALLGSAAALALLLVLILALGPALSSIPLRAVQLVVGTLLLLFGLRWLRKAMLRAAGVIPLHDEEAAYAAQRESLGQAQAPRGRHDTLALLASFKITLLEGLEVVFIIVAVAAGGAHLWIPASLGALAALLLVSALGVLLHRPLSHVPENTLKFGVGVLLTSFGSFWVGEGIGVRWPGDDWSLAGLIGGYLLVALLAVDLCRRAHASRAAALSR